MMNITLPIWNDIISPVFEVSGRWRIYSIDSERVIQNSCEIAVQSRDLAERVIMLCRYDTQVLICGALSAQSSRIITTAGIEVIPFITGSAADVINAYLHDRLHESRYTLPGCRGGGGRHRHRHGHKS